MNTPITIGLAVLVAASFVAGLVCEHLYRHDPHNVRAEMRADDAFAGCVIFSIILIVALARGW